MLRYSAACDRRCRDVVGCWLVGWSQTWTVPKRCVLGLYYYYYYYEIVHEVQKADFKQSTHRDGPKQLTNRAPFNHVTDIS